MLRNSGHYPPPISALSLPKRGICLQTDIFDNESFSYTFAGTWKQLPEIDMSSSGDAYLIVSTPTDLTKFIEALFKLKLISNENLTHMKTKIDGFGMGMS